MALKPPGELLIVNQQDNGEGGHGGLGRMVLDLSGLSKDRSWIGFQKREMPRPDPFC